MHYNASVTLLRSCSSAAMLLSRYENISIVRLLHLFLRIAMTWMVLGPSSFETSPNSKDFVQIDFLVSRKQSILAALLLALEKLHLDTHDSFGATLNISETADFAELTTRLDKFATSKYARFPARLQRSPLGARKTVLAMAYMKRWGAL